MQAFKTPELSRKQIDTWSIEGSGLCARAVNCLTAAGVSDVGGLRGWSEKRLLELRHFGQATLKNVRWFYRWADRLENGNGAIPDFRALLREFLSRDELFVIEQRYGLKDPLFRPHMRRCTLQEVARMRGGITRERVRQIEETAVAALRSRLGRAVAAHHETYWANKILGRGCVATAAEIGEWADDAALGGYQPWGVLLLLSETYERINFRYDYFACLPQQVLNHVEKQILQLLHAARKPVPFEKILSSVSDELSFLNGQRPRLVTVLLDHHPEISGTADRRYFLPSVGAELILTDILRGESRPLHFHELTRLYNERMLPHSRKGTGYILRVLTMMPSARRISRAVYGIEAR
jgi:hypothetical protein